MGRTARGKRKCESVPTCSVSSSSHPVTTCSSVRLSVCLPVRSRRTSHLLHPSPTSLARIRQKERDRQKVTHPSSSLHASQRWRGPPTTSSYGASHQPAEPTPSSSSPSSPSPPTPAEFLRERGSSAACTAGRGGSSPAHSCHTSPLASTTGRPPSRRRRDCHRRKPNRRRCCRGLRGRSRGHRGS